jgi:hypothetical protein
MPTFYVFFNNSASFEVDRHAGVARLARLRPNAVPSIWIKMLYRSQPTAIKHVEKIKKRLMAAASALSRSGASTEPTYSPLLRMMMTRPLRRGFWEWVRLGTAAG